MNTMNAQKTGGNYVHVPERDGPDERAKLKELMLYISDKCIDDNKFCATKLSKILYFADFLSYAHYGKPITGIKYRSLQNGPVPISLWSVKDEMESSHELVVRKQRVVDYHQHRYIALRPSNLDYFTARDIALVDEVISQLSDDNATSVSGRSHDRAWRIYRNSPTMPYNSIFISDDGVTERDVERADELIQKYGWVDV